MRKGCGALALGSCLLGVQARAQTGASAAPAPSAAASAVMPAQPTVPEAAAPAPVAPEAAAPATDLHSVTSPASASEVGVDAEANGGLRPEPFSAKFEAALRIGVGLPFGRAGKNVLDGSGSERDLRDLATWRAPIWLEVDYRATPGLSVGAYLQFGVGGTGDSCTSKCTWSDLRTGAELAYHFAPSASASPWLGLGAGYEWLSFKQLGNVDLPDGSGDTIPFQTTELIGGPELALSGGLDLKVEEALRIGPYATLSVGDYLGDHFKCEPGGLGCPTGSSISGSGAHAWLSIGLRGSFSP